MSKLLFEEVPQKSQEYMRRNRTENKILVAITTVFVLLCIVCLFLKLYLVAAFPFIMVICPSLIFIKSALQKKQQLSVYDDKICYKNTYQRKTKEIDIIPSQYKIEIKHAMPKSGYTIKFIFRKSNGEKILTYKAVSLTPSMFQTKKFQWEIDLFAIGCAILDEQELIKNK